MEQRGSSKIVARVEEEDQLASQSAKIDAILGHLSGKASSSQATPSLLTCYYCISIHRSEQCQRGGDAPSSYHVADVEYVGNPSAQTNP